jgi:HK97 family phage portal protein
MASITDFLSGLFSQKSYDAQDVGSTFRPLGGGKNSTVHEFAREMPSIAYPAINAIASDFASTSLKLFNGEEEVHSHPSLTSIKFPSQKVSYRQLLKTTIMYLLVTGESFWYIPKQSVFGRVKNIYVLNQLLLAEIKYNDAGNPTAFVFSSGNAKKPKIEYSADEILFYHNTWLADLTRGFSPYRPIREYIDASEGAIEYNNRFFQNDATPSGIIKLKSGTSSVAQRQNIKAEWLRSFRSANNAHKIGIMDGDMDFMALGSSMKDMAFRDLMDIAERRILSQYGLSKTIIGQTEDVNRATIEGAEYNYTKRVIKPLLDDFTSFLDTQFLPLFEDYATIQLGDWHFGYENPVQDDMMLNSQIAQVGYTSGIMTLNEARERLGLDPVANGDELKREPTYEPANNEEDQEDNPKALQENQLLRKMVESLKSDLKTTEGYEEMREMYRKTIAERHEKRVVKQEERMESLLASFFKEQEKRVLSGFGVKANSADTFDDEKEREELYNKFRAYFDRLARQAWKEANARIGVDLPIDEERLKQIVDEVAYQFSSDVTKTSSKDVNKVFTDAVSEGLGADEVARRIRGLYQEYTTSRSRTIARTEVNRIVSAITQENFQGASDAGLFEQKEWLAVGDMKTRDDHGVADVQRVPVSKPFRVGPDFMMYPGDRTASAGNTVNCRCTIIPVL